MARAARTPAPELPFEKAFPSVWIETGRPGLFVDTSGMAISKMFNECAQLVTMVIGYRGALEQHGATVAPTPSDADLRTMEERLTALARHFDHRERCKHCDSITHSASECVHVGGSEGGDDR